MTKMINPTKIQKMRAIAYTRVSSSEQISGYSLDIQKEACAKYCSEKGYMLDHTFIEEGESAKTSDRTQLLALTKYCSENRGKVDVLVVHKFDRFARNTGDHLAIKSLLATYGVKLESISEPLTDDPYGKFMETIYSGIAQLDNEIRGERCKAGMVAMFEKGYWPWHAPIGYKNGHVGDQPILLPDKERASFIPMIYDDFNAGFSVKEITDKYDRLGLTSNHGNPLKPMMIIRILTNPLYSGTLQCEVWENTIEGKHKPLITKPQWLMAQARRNKESSLGTRKHPNQGFPLRGTLYCSQCGKKMTASISTGKLGGKFPYYHCFRSGCKQTYTPKILMEDNFFELMKNIQPSPETVKKWREAILNELHEKNADMKKLAHQRERELNELKQERVSCIQKYAQNKIKHEDYNEFIKFIDNKITIKKVELNECTIDLHETEVVLKDCELSLCHIAHFWKLLNDQFRTRLQTIIFPEGVIHENSGMFRTPKISPLFRFINDFEKANDTQKSLIVESVIYNDLYNWAYHCDAVRAIEDLRDQKMTIHWVTSLIAFPYMSPDHLERLMKVLYANCKVGMILSVERLTAPVKSTGAPKMFGHTYEEVLKPSEGTWDAELLAGVMGHAMLLHVFPKK